MALRQSIFRGNDRLPAQLIESGPKGGDSIADPKPKMLLPRGPCGGRRRAGGARERGARAAASSTCTRRATPGLLHARLGGKRGALQRAETTAEKNNVSTLQSRAARGSFPLCHG